MQGSPGFSLLELLLVLALSSLVIIASQQLFFHAKQRYHEQHAIAKTQENAHLALHLLHHALHTAGDGGCLPRAQLKVSTQLKDEPSALTLQGVYGFYGHADRWTPPLPEHLAGRVVQNTDVVLIETAGYERASLAKAMNDYHDPVFISHSGLFAAGDIVLIADCTHADLFRISTVQNDIDGQVLQHLTPENHNAFFSHLYQKDAQVMRWQVEAYYLSHSKQRNAGSALYRHSLVPDRAPIEIVAGIEKLAVNYALLQNSQVHFANAASISDWKQVQAVVLDILAFAPTPIASHQDAYVWQGQNVWPEQPGLYWRTQWAVPLYNQF